MAVTRTKPTYKSGPSFHVAGTSSFEQPVISNPGVYSSAGPQLRSDHYNGDNDNNNSTKAANDDGDVLYTCR